MKPILYQIGTLCKHIVLHKSCTLHPFSANANANIKIDNKLKQMSYFLTKKPIIQWKKVQLTQSEGYQVGMKLTHNMRQTHSNEYVLLEE